MIGQKQKRGLWGEILAARYLRDRGYTILGANYRTRLGEVDLIADGEGVRAFCEVKTRTPDAFGLPLDAVDVKKQRRMIAAAGQYVASRDYQGAIRFDVLEVFLQSDGVGEVRHIKEAFDGDLSLHQGR